MNIFIFLPYQQPYKKQFGMVTGQENTKMKKS